MKFMLTYEIGTQGWDKAVSRFLETGGQPPEGVTMVNRWHAAAGRHGFALLESEDVKAMYPYAAEWQDVCNLTVTPVVDDEQAADVLSSMKN